jgi:hypothetical protein
VTVKEQGAPLDLSSVASVIALGGYLRTHGFDASFSYPKNLSKLISRPAPRRHHAFGPGDIIMTKNESASLESAESWIRAQLAALQGDAA